MLGRPSLLVGGGGGGEETEPWGLCLAGGELWEEQRRFAASVLKALALKKTTLTVSVFLWSRTQLNQDTHL